MRGVPACSVRPSRARTAAGALLCALLMALGVATPAGADASGPPSAWDGYPPDERTVEPPDPKLVLPTDTVVEPPLPDFVPSGSGPQYRGTWRIDGPNVVFGRVTWAETMTGPAAGVRMTFTGQRTGWRYSTTLDDRGRYRVLLPDDTYDVSYADPRLPYGLAEDPAAWGQVAVWTGGLGGGWMGAVVARPRNSCVNTNGSVVAGVDGWAPGADPATTSCPFRGVLAPEAASIQSMIAFTGALADWGLTGHDPAPVRTTETAKWPFGGATSAPAPSPVPAQLAVRAPRLAGALRVGRAGSGLVPVTCPASSVCAGRVEARGPRAHGRVGVLVARGTLRAGSRGVRLKQTVAGRRLLRAAGNRGVRTTVTWTPAGGKTTSLGTLKAARAR